MTITNQIEQAILELEGGAFQKLMNQYLMKKYSYDNLEPLGSQTGTNKTTIGVPDSYVKLNNGKYILIMYGTVKKNAFKKIYLDIKDCIDKVVNKIGEEKIEEIICCHTSSNITIPQNEELENLNKNIKITIIGIGSISNDLSLYYREIVRDHLSIRLPNGQILSIDNFKESYNQKSILNSIIGKEFLYRENKIDTLMNLLTEHDVVSIYGRPGVGKTHFALEVANRYKDEFKAEVYCIQNKGLCLNDDLNYYISNNNYSNKLIFIDEADKLTANNLYLIFNLIKRENKNNIKIIFTLRDYAKTDMKHILCNIVNYEEIEITEFSKNEIDDILVKKFGILNSQYHDQIYSISNGNARLSILAGEISLKSSLYNLYDSSNIFETYYTSIIVDKKLSTNEIIIIFIIKFLGPVDYTKNLLLENILEKYNISMEDFIETLRKLESYNIINLYSKRVASISDASFGDFILYYVLIINKYINLSDLILISFVKYSQKLLYSINTLTHIFNNSYCTNYITDQINLSWDIIEKDSNLISSFISMFCTINTERSLYYVYDKIELLEHENSTLDIELIEKKPSGIKSELYDILAKCKNHENSIELLDVIIHFFNKKPSEISYFIDLLEEIYGYSKFSHIEKYKKENINIDYLFKKSNNGEKINETILLINIIYKYMKFKSKKINIINDRLLIYDIKLSDCIEIKKFRSKIWMILGSLYSNKNYTELINIILEEYSKFIYFDEELMPIYENDFKNIKRYIVDNITNPEFNQCKFIHALEIKLDSISMNNEYYFKVYKENNLFNSYLIIYEIFNQNTSIDNEGSNVAYNIVKDYIYDDFIDLFNNLKHIQKYSNDSTIMEIGIKSIFDSLYNHKELYIEAIKAYFECNTPYSIEMFSKIEILFNYLGFDDSYNLISDFDFIHKNECIFILLSLIDDSKIEAKHFEYLDCIFNNEIQKINPRVPKVYELFKYIKFNSNIIKNYCYKILTLNNHETIYYFLLFNNESDIDLLIEILNDDVYIIENMYLLTYKLFNFDLSGNLFIKLVTNNKDFLIKLFNSIDITEVNQYHLIYKYEKLWIQSDFVELLKIIFDIIIKKVDYKLLELYSCNIQDIFLAGSNCDEFIEIRIIDCIEYFISNNHNNLNIIRLLLRIVSDNYEEHFIDIIKCFLSKNKDINSFEKIYLFPESISFESEESLIDRKIEFIENIKSSIQGLDYIKHRQYLSEKLIRLKNAKDDAIASDKTFY